MKKVFTIFALAFTTLCITACNNDPGPEFTVNLMGVGPILISLSVDRIPDSCDRLYDAYTIEDLEPEREGNDCIAIHFTLTGEPVMTAYCILGQIDSIVVESPKIGSAEGIYPGTEIQHLFCKGGKVLEDNGSRFVLELNGLYYYISGLKHSGEKKLDEAAASGSVPQIKLQDFRCDAKVEGILIF